GDTGMLIQSIRERAQGISGIYAGHSLLDERIGEAVDDIARRDAIHPLPHSLFLQLLEVLLLEVLDILAIIQFELLHQAHTSLLGWLQTTQHCEDTGDTQGIWSNMHILQRA